MSTYEYPDAKALAQGWRRGFREAVDAALEDAEIGEVREIDVIQVKKVSNPIHDYKVVLKPGP
jgi:hypothetical protein